MKNIKNKYLNWDLSKDFDLLTNMLKQHGVFLGPSDTVLGLCGIVSEDVFLRLNELKKRCDKPYLLLVENYQEAMKYMTQEIINRYDALFKRYWPGPLTVIVPAHEHLSSWTTGGKRTIALRVPQHAQLQKLLHIFPALFSTSANKAEHPVPHSLADVDTTIIASVDYVVETLESQPTLPSTIVDLTGDKPVVVRQGAIHFDWHAHL